MPRICRRSRARPKIRLLPNSRKLPQTTASIALIVMMTNPCWKVIMMKSCDKVTELSRKNATLKREKLLARTPWTNFFNSKKWTKRQDLLKRKLRLARS